MRKRYPHTLWNLALVVGFGAVIGLTALWAPFAYVFVGAAAIAMLASGVHDDRKHRGR